VFRQADLCQWVVVDRSLRSTLFLPSLALLPKLLYSRDKIIEIVKAGHQNVDPLDKISGWRDKVGSIRTSENPQRKFFGHQIRKK
jgi:hypothetical protein